MSKITRPRLARGTKLLVEHVTQSVGAVATAVGTAALSRDNLIKKRGVTRLSLQVPCLDSDFFKNAGNGLRNIVFAIPFTLAALQDVWDGTGLVGQNSPPFTLDEFCFSFDQRREPAAIADRWNGGGVEGDLNYDGVGAYDISISLVEKSQWYFNNAASLSPEGEVFSMRLTPETIAAGLERNNPFCLSDMGKQLNPYKTYMLVVSCPKLFNIAANMRTALVSMTFALKLLTPLTQRDDLTRTVQNLPAFGGGGKNVKAVSQHAIAGNDTIEEDDIQGNISTVDQRFLQGLEGGYTAEGLPPTQEELLDDSCYEIICVPMWSNFGTSRALHAGDCTDGAVPYVGVNPCDAKTVDERHIPINFPWVLHHVVAAVSYASPAGDAAYTGGGHPASITFVSEVGVSLVGGQRADDLVAVDVAYALWTPAGGAAPKANLMIDKCNATPICIQGLVPIGEAWDYELLSVPLKGAGGVGYYAQGDPIYIGRTNFGGSGRSNLNGVSPATAGQETLLQVRWAMQDVNGMAANDLAPFPATGASATDTYVGYSGHWVFLIGKKSLCGNPRDVSA